MSIVDETYATVEEADVIIGENDTWEDAEPDEKQEALEWATVYIDETYYVDDPDPIPQSLKNANSLLAVEQLTKSLWDRQTGLGPVTFTSVQAGSVKSTKGYKQQSQSAWQDPFPHITAMLENDGYEMKKNQSAVSLVRQ